MDKTIGYKIVYEVSLALMAFLMLVVPKLIAIGVIVYLGIIIVGIIKHKFKFSINLMNVLILLLYLSYAIGSLYTEHPDIAVRYLEYKMMLVFFPILFSFQLKEKLSLKLPSIGLFFGVIVLMVLGVIHSIGLYLETSNLSSFVRGMFSYIHHPTYFSSFTFVAMLLAQYAKEQRWLGDKKSVYTTLISLMILCQFLSLSFAGILMLLIYGSFMLLRWVSNHFGKIYFLAVLVISPIVIFFFISKAPGIKLQFETSKKFMVEYVKDPISFIELDQTYVQGDEARLIMWTVSALEFADNPMGAGTGNVDDKLKIRLEDFGQYDVANHNYNSHNQFLQTAVEVGIFGLLFLLGIIGYSIYLGFRFKNMFITFLGINLAFNSLFESMLQRQSGIVFFTFWLCLISVVLLSRKSIANKRASFEN